MNEKACKWTRRLAVAAMAAAMASPLAAGLAAGDGPRDEGPVTYAMIDDVLNTYVDVKCQTTAAHNTVQNKTYQRLVFKTSYALRYKEIVSSKVKYPCGKGVALHKAAYNKIECIYDTW